MDTTATDQATQKIQAAEALAKIQESFDKFLALPRRFRRQHAAGRKGTYRLVAPRVQKTGSASHWLHQV